MTKSLHLALILTGGLVFGSISALAAEPLSRHPARTDPRFEHWRHEAQELIDIACSCDSPAAVRLFLHCADYLALVESFVHEMPDFSWLDGNAVSGL